jgi:hypothetical protein
VAEQVEHLEGAVAEIDDVALADDSRRRRCPLFGGRCQTARRDGVDEQRAHFVAGGPVEARRWLR